MQPMQSYQTGFLNSSGAFSQMSAEWDGLKCDIENSEFGAESILSSQFVNEVLSFSFNCPTLWCESNALVQAMEYIYSLCYNL